MKCVIPEISYHNRDPVLSLDFQLCQKTGDPLRLATAGTDKHVVIFSVLQSADGQVELECLSDLIRHQKAVNIVRWSPDGNILASGDDESYIILWQLKQSPSEAPSLFDEDMAENKENWVVYKILRNHLDDVCDLSWSPCSQFILSGSVDNSAIITNVHKNQKVGHLSDSQGFVQGVSWNPKHNVLATLSSDRKCRFYNTVNRKLIGKTYKANLGISPDVLKKKKKSAKPQKEEENKLPTASDSTTKDTTTPAPVPTPTSTPAIATVSESTATSSQAQEAVGGVGTGDEKTVRLFHDDTFKGFSRRLFWSPDGELLLVPSGVVETDADAKLSHCAYMFTRIDLNRPAVCLPTKDKYTVATRFCSSRFKLRPIKRKGVKEKDGLSPWEIYETVFCLPYRHVYAVATQNAVMIYDTQQAAPIARVSNIHYTGLTDLTWSPDGRILMVSSKDGFCSIISFADGELGDAYIPDTPEETPCDTPIDTPATTPQPIESLELDDVEDVEDTVQPMEAVNHLEEEEKVEDVDLDGFNEQGVKSPAQVTIKSTKEGGKANPKRLKFITLSSPKADKRPMGNKPTSVASLNQEDAMDGMDELDGVECMEPDLDDLHLELEDSQAACPVLPVPPTVTAAPTTQVKKRVPLTTISTSTGPNILTNNSKGSGGPEMTSGAAEQEQEKRKGRRAELITLSSPKPKSNPH